MSRAKGINSGIVDEDIDMPVAKLDRASGDCTGTRSVPKVRLNEVCLSARRSDCCSRFLATLLVAANDQYVDT
jgi:hypothetical protein